MFVKFADDTENLRREFNIGYSELEEIVKLDGEEIGELREMNYKYKQEVEWLELEVMTEYGIENDGFGIDDYEISCRVCREGLSAECNCEEESERLMREYIERLGQLNDRYIVEVGWYGNRIQEIWMRCCMVN